MREVVGAVGLGDATVSMKLLFVPGLALLSACSTGMELLKLQRAQLLEIEKAALNVESYASGAHYDPGRYDLYLFLNSNSFNNILQAFDNLTFETDVGARRVAFTLDRVRTSFRPGYPDMIVAARARDIRTGIVARVEMDARWLVESDEQVTDRLFLRLVARRVVPDLAWGPFSLGKSRFARQLMQLEATKLTRNVPRLEIPVERKFDIGNDAGFVNLAGMRTGDGTMDGRVSYPSTRIRGTIRICHVLFLKNGIHVFADVKGLGTGEQPCAATVF